MPVKKVFDLHYRNYRNYLTIVDIFAITLMLAKPLRIWCHNIVRSNLAAIGDIFASFAIEK
jgi:hypothetical protein